MGDFPNIDEIIGSSRKVKENGMTWQSGSSYIQISQAIQVRLSGEVNSHTAVFDQSSSKMVMKIRS